jgi:hypothetical protein
MNFLTHEIISQPRLANEGVGFALMGQFRVNMKLGDETDWKRFQYRQYIKGNCRMIQGRFSSPAHSRANWIGIGLDIPGNMKFDIPGGLNTYYSEDGEVINGRTYRFGYRTNPPVNMLGLEDRYLPSQESGRVYQLMDTCGMRGDRRISGLRIIYNLFYEGCIIDTKRTGVHKVLTKRWEIRADEIIP